MERRALVASLALAVALATLAAAQQMGGGPPPKNPSFERLKTLEGTWTGKAAWDESGQKGTDDVTVVYKVTAAGSAVQETLFPGTPHEMVTMYHLDGGQLVLTHYCAAGNQPHMKLEDAKDPNLLSFRCAGGSNMTETDMHMHAARIAIVDADHIKGAWMSAKDGKPAGESSFDLSRKK